MTQRVRIVRTREDYDTARQRLAELVTSDLKPGSDEEEEFELLRLVVGDYDRKYAKQWPLDPIQAITFRMEQQGLGKRDLEPFIGSPSRVSEVLAGKRNLTVSMMRRLHSGLGIPARSLIGDDDLGEAVGDEEVQYDFSKFPLAEMLARGMFHGVVGGLTELKHRAEELIAPVLRGSGIGAHSPALLRAPMHQSGSRTMDEYALLVWRVRVVAKAHKKPPRATYKEGVITPKWLRDLAKLSSFDEGPRLAQEYLSRSGVCLVVEEHFKKTYLDGAAMLCTNFPIVALTLRHDRIDNFWFALIHECIHVAKHLRLDRMFIADNLEDKSRKGRQEEDEADEGARDALIPKEVWANASVRKTHSQHDAIDLAEQLGIHPAVVAGRLRWETGNWRLLSGLVTSDTVKHHFEDQLN
jgi:HTH-type transcriptional regulator/antitoxin HigA